MKITHNGTRFELALAIDPATNWVSLPEITKAKDAGFAWDREAKVWWTCDVAVVGRLKGTGATTLPEVKALIAAESERAAQTVAQSRATDSSIAIPCPVGLALLPYQRAGVAYALGRESTLLADQMGLGKSPMSVCVANADPATRRVLIVCPASLKLNWRKEFLRWDAKGLSVGVVGHKKGNQYEDVFLHEVVIINYDILGKHYDAIRVAPWDLLVVDEVHFLKNPKTARTKQVFGSKRAKIEPIRARRRLFLSGTPIVNKPIELFGLLQSIDADGLGSNFMKYALRYCAAVKGHFGWDFSGASNLEELQEQLRSRIMIRRLKQDVLKELPPKRRQVVVLESNAKIDKLIEKEKQSYEEYEKTGGEVTTPAFAEMSAARKAVALAKVPFVIEYIQEALDETEKIVVFAHHLEAIDKITEAFGDAAVRVDGRVSIEDRQSAIDRFQSDPSCRVFVGGIQAAGVGLTLTAASVVIFAELDWVPGNVTQCEDRLHRIGQKDAVQVQHLVLEGSLDERMVEIIIDKQRVIDQALDTPPKKGELYR